MILLSGSWFGAGARVRVLCGMRADELLRDKNKKKINKQIEGKTDRAPRTGYVACTKVTH